MNPYVVSVSGVWPNERYVYNINPSVIDYRLSQMPIKFICAPYYTEDNNLTELTYLPPKLNQLVGLSGNSNYFVTPYNLEFNVNVIPNLTFTWSPSSLRKENRGNVFSSLMLADGNQIYHGATVYPSQLFLFPLSASIINSYGIFTNNISLSVFNISELIPALVDIERDEGVFVDSYSATEIIPPVSSIWYSISTQYMSAFNTAPALNSFLTDNFTFFWLSSTLSINNFGLSTVSYVLSSPYVSSDRYSFASDFNYFYDSIKNFTYQSYVLMEYASAVDVITLNYIITSHNYFLQTSTVLLDFYEYQFADWAYGKKIKNEHNKFLSQKLTLQDLSTTQNINLDNIMYELSGSITYGKRPIITYYDDINPVYYNEVLEESGYVIRPDTVRMQYFIEFYDFLSKSAPFVRGIGDTYDDLILNRDNSLESTYILKQDNTLKTLTFQLLQSSINSSLPLEDSSNCVLSAVLNFNTSKFEYFNTAKYVYNTDNYGVNSPISGVRNSDLSLKYIAETSYFKNTLETVSSTLISISSYPAVALNSPITWSNHNKKVNWNLKYPPYYYSFKNSYKKQPDYNYENKNTLNFYLTSVLVSSNVIDVSDFKCAEVVLYNTIYSDFDIIELPLKTYGTLDYIRFQLNNKVLDPMLNMDYLSAFLVLDNGYTEFYDITAGLYVPAVSGSRLKLLYNLNQGGTIISIKPCLSTAAGALEGYWSTTFPMALDYKSKNYTRPITVNTLSQDLSSITLSVKHLSGDDPNLDLSFSYISWNYFSNDSVVIENLIPDNHFTTLKPSNTYIFEDAHTVKITGISNQSLVVSVSSQKYNTTALASSDGDYFDLYAENNISVDTIFSNKKNKIKALGARAMVSYFSKKISLPPEAAVSWTWEYDNIQESNSIPVSAYEDSNFTIPYKYGSIKQNNEIYFLIDTEYTFTESYKPFLIKAEVYDQGKIIDGNLTVSVNSYPNPYIVSTDFIAVYDKFPDTEILNTTHNLKSLTRPPNGTNVFKFIPQKLQTTNVYISALSWQIDSNYIYNNSTLSTPITTTIIPLSTNNTGDYETAMVMDFNVYTRTYKDYRNFDYINNNSPKTYLIQNELNMVLSSISVDALKQKNSYLVYLSSAENSSPIVTSLFVASTSKYTSSFDIPNNFSFLNNFNNLYSTYYYTSTISVLSGTTVLYTYTNYVVDFWLSSSKTEISTDSNIINLFYNNNINNKTNLLYLDTQFNLTTSLSYGISADVISSDMYYYNTVTLKAENVSIPGWDNLYDFQQSSLVVVTNIEEFTTSPKIFIIPKLSWVPENNKKANRFLQALDIQYDSFNSYYNALSGKIYENKKDLIYGYDLKIIGVQDRQISNTDKLAFIFALSSSNSQILLEDQILNEQGEYIIDTNKRDVIVKNLKLPYNSEMLNPEGMSLSLTAFNKFFPPDGGILYYGLKDITSTELEQLSYPITAKTDNRIYDGSGKLVSDLRFMSPRLSKYEPCKLIFYPKLNVINLDEGGLIEVKQILETNPPNSPNIIDFNLSTVTYTLSSDHWVTYVTIPAFSSAHINLFNLTVGDAMTPLQVSNYNTSSLVISASARVATKIPSSTFDKTSGYTGETDLWETVYEEIIGNTENTYKFLNFEISSVTGTLSTYHPITTGNDWVLVI